MLTSLRKVSLRLCLRQEPQPERRTGSWGQPGRMNPKRASPLYRPGRIRNLRVVAEEGRDVEDVLGDVEPLGRGGGRGRPIGGRSLPPATAPALPAEARGDDGDLDIAAERVVDHSAEDDVRVLVGRAGD